mgnify:CR=1 FL=1
MKNASEEVTCGMTIAKADALEDLTPTKQTKRGPRQNALGEFIASKPSSLKRKPVATEENTGGAGGSSEGKTILRKTSLSVPVGYNLKTSYSAKGEAAVYYPRLPRSWMGNGLIVVPSLSEKGVKGSYELFVNSSEPVKIKQLPDSYYRSIAGEWTESTAGGNHLSALWKKNPRYVLKFRNANKGSAPARMRIVLSKHGDRWARMNRKDTVGCMVGFYIFHVTKETAEGKSGESDPRGTCICMILIFRELYLYIIAILDHVANPFFSPTIPYGSNSISHNYDTNIISLLNINIMTFKRSLPRPRPGRYPPDLRVYLRT